MKRKYVYKHFDVFAKANGQNIELKGEAKQGQKVVLLNVVEGLDNTCRIVAMDNFFYKHRDVSNIIL